METKILIAEDEANIRRLVASYMVKEGFKIVEAQDGQEALEKFEDMQDCSLIILDVMMPKLDGFGVLKHIRQHSDVPVLMLTARDTEFDELEGFRNGADEYISKPFSPTILVTRVKNLLKRTSANDMSDLEVWAIKMVYRERAVWVNGQPVVLTPKEYDLLYYLMKNKNIVLTRDMILSSVWGLDYDGDDRTVDTHIKCLRAKLAGCAGYITTIRKVGYKFACTQD